MIQWYQWKQNMVTTAHFFWLSQNVLSLLLWNSHSTHHGHSWHSFRASDTKARWPAWSMQDTWEFHCPSPSKREWHTWQSQVFSPSFSPSCTKVRGKTYKGRGSWRNSSKLEALKIFFCEPKICFREVQEDLISRKILTSPSSMRSIICTDSFIVTENTPEFTFTWSSSTPAGKPWGSLFFLS